MRLTIIYPCGITENTKAFYREFVRQGLEVSVIVPRKVRINPVHTKGGVLTVSERDFESDYKFIPIDLINIDRYGFGFYQRQLFEALKISQPDIIHVFNEYPSITTVQAIFCRNSLFGQRVPILNYGFQNVPYNIFSPASLQNIEEFVKRLVFYPFIFAYIKKYINGATASNQEAIDNIKASNPNIPLEHIFWGVDFNDFYPQDRKLCREKRGLPQDIKLVGYFGRFVEEKGLIKLITAISRLKDYHLMLIGDGDYGAVLKTTINSLGIEDRVHWYDCCGPRELGEYYNCLDGFILPSQTTVLWKEQYGKVLAEAMACNISVIGSSSGAIPQVLKGYPKHLIFKEDSLEDLVDKIRRVDSLQFSDNFDINAFLNKFSIENFVSKHIEFYKQLTA